jgi:hypothetical protein
MLVASPAHPQRNATQWWMLMLREQIADARRLLAAIDMAWLHVCG